MSNTLEFKGPWNPALGAFPVISSDTTACYFLVTSAGQVDGYTFEEGDWLIYVEETDSSGDTTGKWLRSEGGIIQANVSASAPSTVFGEPGTYTKVTVNPDGQVVSGKYLEASDMPLHSQDAATITNFVTTARTAVGPMFVNTARSNAVDFTYDDKTNTVSADVRVDNSTIVKNRFGQLVAMATELVPHTHAIEDIAGISKDDLESLTPASRQRLQLPSDGSYNGLHNLEGYLIHDAFDILNTSLKEANNTVDQIYAGVEQITPVPPISLEEITLELENSTLFPAAKANTGEIVEALFNPTPRTAVTPRFAGSPDGTVVAVIDGVEDPQAAIITHNDDHYVGEPAFQGWYTSIAAYIAVYQSLDPGNHTLELRYKEDGTVVTSKPLSLYIAASQSTGRVDTTNTTFSRLPNLTRYVSGVPSSPSNDRDITIEKLWIEFAVGTHYRPDNILRIFGGEPGVLPEEGVWADPTHPAQEDSWVYVHNTSFTIKDEFASPAFFEAETYDIFGNISTAQSIGIPGMRNDPTPEAQIRVQSGAGSERHPDIYSDGFGQPYDSTKSLLTDYLSELQLEGNVIRWPNEDYRQFGGDDYSIAGGTNLNVGFYSPQYRWITIPFSVTELSAFDLHFERVNGTWPLTLNRTIPDMYMYGCVVDWPTQKTGWVDFNKPFPGYGAARLDGDGALDIGKSSQTIRRITFGSGGGPHTGTLYIRIGLPIHSDYIIQNISITPASH